jgi:hypothetical protein
LPPTRLVDVGKGEPNNPEKVKRIFNSTESNLGAENSEESNSDSGDVTILPTPSRKRKHEESAASFSFFPSSFNSLGATDEEGERGIESDRMEYRKGERGPEGSKSRLPLGAVEVLDFMHSSESWSWEGTEPQTEISMTKGITKSNGLHGDEPRIIDFWQEGPRVGESESQSDIGVPKNGGERERGREKETERTKERETVREKEERGDRGKVKRRERPLIRSLYDSPDPSTKLAQKKTKAKKKRTSPLAPSAPVAPSKRQKTSEIQKEDGQASLPSTRRRKKRDAPENMALQNTDATATTKVTTTLICLNFCPLLSSPLLSSP